MNLTQLTSSDLKQILKLLEQKEALQRQVADIDAQLADYSGAAPAQPPPSRQAGPPRPPKAAKGKRAQRGEVKAAIVQLVKSAGQSGITLKAVAGKVGQSYHRVSAWFYKTGQRIPQIKKVGPGTYAWFEKK
jgi:hypothetical protein